MVAGQLLTLLSKCLKSNVISGDRGDAVLQLLIHAQHVCSKLLGLGGMLVIEVGVIWHNVCRNEAED